MLADRLTYVNDDPFLPFQRAQLLHQSFERHDELIVVVEVGVEAAGEFSNNGTRCPYMRGGTGEAGGCRKCPCLCRVAKALN